MGKINALNIKQAVILAGGAGTRLQPFTLKNPKPLIPINGKPFIDYLITLLKDQGIKEIILLIGYKGEKIIKHLGDGSKLNISIKYSYTPFKNYQGEEIKSGARILNAHELLNNHFLLLYCDNYMNFNINKLKDLYSKKQADVLVSVFSNFDSSTKNNIQVNDGIVKKYDKTRFSKNLNGVDIGFMIVNKEVLRHLPEKNVKFEDIIFPYLIKQDKLAGFITNQKYYSIGDHNRVKVTAKFLKSKKFILLDRDGVINKKAPKADYVKNWSEFEFLPKAKEALKLLTDNKYEIFIISNQAGIARKIMTEDDLKNIHKRMISELRKIKVKISGIYYCPHGWDENCFCRKPKPGMLLQASREHLLDLSKAVFIGDDIRDKQAGDEAGCKTILVNKNNNLLSIVEKIIRSN